ncbi:MAG: class II aldolase/adducin family protein [Gammaproteobacteria bacterium]|nr:class II aldolase/adducin family protein [Gammaproteobacteria bacterium]
MNSKQQLIQYYQWLRQYGYNDSHSGNASIYDPDNDQIWVTPSGACADTLTSNELVAVNTNTTHKHKGSLDTPLHLAVYQKKPSARAVLHSHGAYSVAATLDGKDFVPVDFEGQYYFEKVPVITIPYNEYVAQAADAVSSMLADYPITVVRGHGVYATAENLNLAYKWTCSFELSAKTWLLARQAGTL